MHARARSSGFIAHTSTFDVAWRVNGVDLTETHIIALSAARWGIPVIMVSGDNVLKDQLALDFPDVEYATVKEAKSLTSAEAVPRAETDQRIERPRTTRWRSSSAASTGLTTCRDRTYFRLSFRTSEQARMAGLTRGVAEDGGLGVRFESPTFIDGYVISKDVISHALNPLPLLLRVLRHQGDSTAIKQWIDLIWGQIDPSTLPAWALPTSPNDQPKRYYGDECVVLPAHAQLNRDQPGRSVPRPEAHACEDPA